jgi:hypothetical protein
MPNCKQDIILRLSTNPRRIFRLPAQPRTYVEVDMDSEWCMRGDTMHSLCAWTPFEGWRGHGRVRRVVLRGEEAYIDGRVLVPAGFGRNVREPEYAELIAGARNVQRQHTPPQFTNAGRCGGVHGGKTHWLAAAYASVVNEMTVTTTTTSDLLPASATTPRRVGE